MLLQFFVLLICLGGACVLSSRRLMHYFQLESYQFQGYAKTILRQWKRAILPYLLTGLMLLFLRAVCVMTDGALSALQADIQAGANAAADSAAGALEGALLSAVRAWGMTIVLSLGGAACLLCIHSRAKKSREKKKFVLTARVKRLYLVHSLVILFLFGLSYALSDGDIGAAALGMTAVCALLPLVTALSALLALPIEKLIFRLYFRDAERKLMENERLIRIGITGSYGKTSTKFILSTILSQKYNVLATPASFNTPMGVTRIIRERLSPSHQVFIGEMGARHVGEIRELSRLVHPDIGILTAVGPQHLDTFRTLERIKQTKYELIDALPGDGFAVFSHDGGIVTELYEKTKKPKALVGTEQGDVWAENVHVSPEGSHFTLMIRDWEPLECTTPLLGEHNIQNILMACAVARHLALNREQIARGIAALRPVEHRLQLLRSAGGITVIDDAFNTNPRSSREALKVLASFPGRRIIVTPGMVELGTEEEKYNYEFGLAMAGAADIAVLVGKKHTAPIRRGLMEAGFPEKSIHVAASLEEALAFGRECFRPGDVVMYENDLPDHYSEG